MMYLPYKSDQREEAIKLMVDLFDLVFPEKVAEEAPTVTQRVEAICRVRPCSDPPA
jgi:hypothetical protein